MIRVTLEPPVVEQKVTIEMSMKEARAIRMLMGKQLLSELRSSGLEPLWDALLEKVTYET